MSADAGSMRIFMGLVVAVYSWAYSVPVGGAYARAAAMTRFDYRLQGPAAALSHSPRYRAETGVPHSDCVRNMSPA